MKWEPPPPPPPPPSPARHWRNVGGRGGGGDENQSRAGIKLLSQWLTWPLPVNFSGSIFSNDGETSLVWSTEPDKQNWLRVIVTALRYDGVAFVFFSVSAEKMKECRGRELVFSFRGKQRRVHARREATLIITSSHVLHDSLVTLIRPSFELFSIKCKLVAISTDHRPWEENGESGVKGCSAGKKFQYWKPCAESIGIGKTPAGPSSPVDCCRVWEHCSRFVFNSATSRQVGSLCCWRQVLNPPQPSQNKWTTLQREFKRTSNNSINWNAPTQSYWVA